MIRVYYGFAAVLALVASATFAIPVLTDPEHVRPPHAGRPTAGVTSSPPSLAAVGGEQPDAALTAAHAVYARAIEEAIYAHAIQAAISVAATRTAPSSGVVASGDRAAAPNGVGDAWASLRECESGGNYAAATGNGFYGAYQFVPSTWRGAVSGAGWAEWASVLPSDAPPEVQDAAAQHLQSVSGWGPWPACSRKLGLR